MGRELGGLGEEERDDVQGRGAKYQNNERKASITHDNKRQSEMDARKKKKGGWGGVKGDKV